MEEFNNQWLFYALDDMRYGQAFCKHFDLGNSTPLYNFRDTAMCKRWIKENYLLKNAN